MEKAQAAIHWLKEKTSYTLERHDTIILTHDHLGHDDAQEIHVDGPLDHDIASTNEGVCTLLRYMEGKGRVPDMV